MRRLAWAALFAAIGTLRLTQGDVLWVEECYPAAAAIQVLHGKLPYRDFVFDKPPLSIGFYLLFGAQTGVALRIAGSLYVLLCAFLASRVAGRLWNPATGWVAAIGTAFAMTFYFPAATIALAPDVLMVAPHLAAILAAISGWPLAAGALAGLALHVNTKAVFVAGACAAWGSPARVLIGFAAVAVPPLAAIPGYWDHVWAWGLRYAADTAIAEPLRNGLSRSANWAGFHAAFLLAAAAYWWKERTADSRRLGWWLAVSFAAAASGWRFFPRYFFQAIPPLAVAASRGFARSGAVTRVAIALLLAVPAVRFGGVYLRGAANRDLAMGRDADAAAAVIAERMQPGDTILVWGYRPEILVRTRLALGTPFLDSQPLTGVLADRHLQSSTPTFAAAAKVNRERLAALRPTFVVDGLGRYNAALGIAAYGELREWRAAYREIGRTHGCFIYKLR
ncbi:MAG: hypothetical protein R2729_30230 [Bryobacteraceae bacterium]